MPDSNFPLLEPLLRKTLPHSASRLGERLLQSALLSFLIGWIFAVLFSEQHSVMWSPTISLPSIAMTRQFMQLAHALRLGPTRVWQPARQSKLAHLMSSTKSFAKLKIENPPSLPPCNKSRPNIDCRPHDYEIELRAKVAHVRSLFDSCGIPNETYVARSALKRFRMHAQFRMWHTRSDRLAEGESPLNYVMFDPGSKTKIFLNGTVEDSAFFPMGSEQLNDLMFALLKECSHNEVLKYKLFQVDFYTTLSGDALVCLQYHKKLGDNLEWRVAAEILKAKLGCELMARSKKEKILFGSDSVSETMHIDGVALHLKKKEGAFSQSNGGVACQMVSWARAAAVEGEVGIANPPARGDDLVELYAGSGMFSIALAPLFQNVVATEISKPATVTGRENVAANNITNLQFVRLSAEEFSEAWNGTSTYKRLQHMSPKLEDMDIRTVLVDPPRAGLGDHVTDIVSRFDRIIYISCNPTTCRRDYEIMRETHEIARLAVFDQFPYTSHVEMGILLKRRADMPARL